MLVWQLQFFTEAFQFSDLNKATSAYNLYHSDFWYIYDLESGQVPDLSIISQCGKY